MRTRIGWASAIAVVGLALALALAGAQGATAVQGQALIAGQANTETNETIVNNTTESVPGCTADPGSGLQGCGGDIGLEGTSIGVGVLGNGNFGVSGYGKNIGVYGDGISYGIVGSGGPSGYGVYGSGDTGILGEGGENGVQATGGTFGVFATGDDYGVYASAPNYGIYGDSQEGTGVYASSQNGTALNVQGKIVSKRSGIVTLAASSGVPYVSVTLMKMTASTFIVATVQGNAAGVWVRSVGISPPTDTFKIYLNKVPSSDVRIGWFAMR